MKNLFFSFAVVILFSLTALAQDGWFWQNPKPQGNGLNSVSTLNADFAVAVGFPGTVIKTTDGGQSWNVKHNVGSFSKNLYAVSFIDINNGWAAGEDGKIISTSDGVKVGLSKTVKSLRLYLTYSL